MRRRRRRRRVWRAAKPAAVESLESRTLLSGSSVLASEVHLSDGSLQLRVQGGSGNDRINVEQSDLGLLVTENGASQTFAGPFQSLVINAGAGNDSIILDPSVHIDATLYAGGGKNVLQAGSGNDTLVCVGSSADTLIGGSGSDSFWTDASAKEKILNLRPDETADGAVHRVASIYAGPSRGKKGGGNSGNNARSLLVRKLAEPATTDGSVYQNFSSHPLFSAAGPSEDDINQGAVGDCYYLSVLSSVAKLDPWKIRQSVLDMGDGTYLVQFSRGGNRVFVRVDGQLPVIGNGQPDYAGLGQGGSLWVAIMEKAYAVFHGPTPSYGSIDGGWMDQSYAALGDASSSIYGAATPGLLLSQIQSEVLAGKSVTYATYNVADNAPLLPSHAYAVARVNTDMLGNPLSVTLRNPWGVDGAGNDGLNDGYVTVTAQQAYDSMLGVVSAYV